MNDEDLKKIAKLIKEELRPIKEVVEVVKQKVDHQEFLLISTTSNIRAVKEQQSVINEKLDQHTETLVSIENTINAYADMYKINNSNSKKLEKRIGVLEDKSGVISPPEHTLVDV